MFTRVLAMGVGLCLLAAIAPAAEPAKAKPLAAIDEKDLAKALERHKGKVVLVDFWALWCATCIEAMPHTSAMQKELASRGLVVVTVSLDDLGDTEGPAELLASKAPALTENYQSKFGGSDDSITRFRIPDGTLPHLRLYDRQGKLRRGFPESSGKFDSKQIRAAVLDLLSEKP